MHTVEKRTCSPSKMFKIFMENIASLLFEAWQTLGTTTQSSGQGQLAACLRALPCIRSSLGPFRILLSEERGRETSKSVEKIPSELPEATAWMHVRNERARRLASLLLSKGNVLQSAVWGRLSLKGLTYN